MGFVRFAMVRMAVCSLIFVSSAAVIGLSGFLATEFMHNKYDRPFIIYALILSCFTLFAAAFLGFRYSFRTHIGVIGFLVVLWLGLASFVTDRIGYVQCESFDGQSRATDSGGSYPAVAWCRELKAIMGLAWFNFGMLLIAVVSWIRLEEDEERRGFRGRESRRESYREAELGGYLQNGAYATGGYPMGPGGVVPQGTVVYQQPGNNVVVSNGQIRQIPVGQPVY